MSASSVARFIGKEIKEVIPPTLFFAAGFNLIVLTINLILHDYHEQFSSFLLATVAALVVGKAVLIANALPFFRRLDAAPLIRPVLFKSFIYFVITGLVRVLEKAVEYLSGGGTLGGIPQYVETHFSWDRFFAVQLWVLILFLIYTTIIELNNLFGYGELYRIMFTWRPAALKMTRRQRVRALIKLGKLTDAHGAAELADPNTRAHAELVGLLRDLARSGPPATEAAPLRA